MQNKLGDKMINLIHGDCLEEMKKIPDGSIDLVLTDPPYLINYRTNHRKNKIHDFCSEIKNDGLESKNMLIHYFNECHRIMKNNTAGYFFCSSKTVDFFKQELEKAFTIKNQIIWVKNNWTAGDLKGQFGQQYEIIFLVNKGRKELIGKRFSDVWIFNRVSGLNQYHQNQKPTDLLKRAITSHSFDNDVVFDGFMGSGSTGVACANTNRNFIGIELDKNYFDIAKKRINDNIAKK